MEKWVDTLITAKIRIALNCVLIALYCVLVIGKVNKMLAAQERTAPASQTIRSPTMPKKHNPHLCNIVNPGTHRFSLWHSVVCPSDSAHSRQYEITPELDFLHGFTSQRGHPGPGLHFITFSPLVSAGNSSPLRQYSPSSSLLSSGQEYPQPSSSIGGISTAREKECLPFSLCRTPQRPHSQSSKYSRPSIVFINHQKQQLTRRSTGPRETPGFQSKLIGAVR